MMKFDTDDIKAFISTGINIDQKLEGKIQPANCFLVAIAMALTNLADKADDISSSLSCIENTLERKG